MPDESCRRCGGLLLEYTICAKCRDVTKFVCRNCAHKTLERFHDGFCFIITEQCIPVVAGIQTQTNS
jgi:hypothetical protein